jgi:hypothetical protein
MSVQNVPLRVGRWLVEVSEDGWRVFNAEFYGGPAVIEAFERANRETDEEKEKARG